MMRRQCICNSWKETLAHLSVTHARIRAHVLGSSVLGQVVAAPYLPVHVLEDSTVIYPAADVALLNTSSFLLVDKAGSPWCEMV